MTKSDVPTNWILKIGHQTFPCPCDNLVREIVADQQTHSEFDSFFVLLVPTISELHSGCLVFEYSDIKKFDEHLHILLKNRTNSLPTDDAIISLETHYIAVLYLHNFELIYMSYYIDHDKI